MLRPDQILLMYDGACPFCTSVAHVLQRLDWREKICPLPYQTRGLPEAVGVTVQRARRSAIVFSPGGHVWSKGGSIAASLDALLPFGLPLFRGLYLIPGMRWLTDRFYLFLSRHRSRMPIGSADLSHDGAPPILQSDVEQELTRRRLARHMPTALPAGSSVALH